METVYTWIVDGSNWRFLSSRPPCRCFILVHAVAPYCGMVPESKLWYAPTGFDDLVAVRDAPKMTLGVEMLNEKTEDVGLRTLCLHPTTMEASAKYPKALEFNGVECHQEDEDGWHRRTAPQSPYSNGAQYFGLVLPNGWGILRTQTP